MKRYLLLLNLLTFSIVLHAQIPEDALRYSFYPQSGTARNIAIGGAMGSLGGDLNATFVNPAGLGFYKTGEVVLSPGFFLHNNKADFRGTQTKEKANVFGLGTSGFVSGYAQRYKPKSSNAFSIAFTQTASFNNHIKYSGLNNYSSFSEQFAEEFAKSGLTIDQVLNVNSQFPYSAAVALYTYLIDTVKVGNLYQVKGAPEYILDAGEAIRQEMDKQTNGGIYEVALGFAHNSEDKWFIGGTLSLPFVYYKSNTTFKESDTSSKTNNYFNSFVYNDDFTTRGMGIAGRLGVIYRPEEYIRLGLAIHTPMYLGLTDSRRVSLNTSLENPIGNFNITSDKFTNDQKGESKYVQTNAWKVIGSASYVFREVENVKRQKGFITADVEYVHHKGSRFSSDNEQPTDLEKAYYKSLNQVIKEDYKGAFNFRVGGELKFNVIMGRLGFAYYGNPYAKELGYKASRMLLSGGLGYRNKGMFIDLTYVHAISKDADVPYRLSDRANTYASLKQQRGNVMATIGFKF
ncbi:MAG: hypothetical protein U0V75_12445 [Ferruginibacter sp.]